MHHSFHLSPHPLHVVQACDLLKLYTPNPHTLPCLKQERDNGVQRRSESTHRKALSSSIPFKFSGFFSLKAFLVVTVLV